MALKADIAAPPFLPSQMRGGTQVGPGISCWIQDGWKGDMSLLGRVSGVVGEGWCTVNKDCLAKVHNVNIPVVVISGV